MYHANQPPSGIRYAGYCFTPPIPLINANLPTCQGLYVILVSDDAYKPWKFRPLYFGEAENLRSRVGFLHEKCSSWLLEAKNEVLYVGVLPTTGYTDQQRKALEEALIKRYCPPCNIKHNPFKPPTGFFGGLSAPPKTK